MKQIAIDIRYLSRHPTGVGRYIQQLLIHLENIVSEKVTLYLLGHDTNFQHLPNSVRHFKKIRSPYLPELHPLADIWFYQSLPKLLQKHKIELFHATALGAPLHLSDIPWIVTIHDLVGLEKPLTLPFFFRQYLNWQTGLAMKNATHLITTTKSVSSDITRHFPDHPPVTVIPLGYEKKGGVSITSNPGLAIKNRFILFVGTLEKRKGLLHLLEAFRILREDLTGETLDLVLCGKVDTKNKKLQKAIRRSPYQENIHTAGYVTEAQLQSYYKHSSLTVAPSLYEGFGLPVLEAMQGNAPILANDIPVFHETGGNLLHFTSFQDPRAAATSMARCLKEDGNAKDLFPQYQKHLCQFSWRTLAESTLDLYLKTIEGSGPSFESEQER